ncbi:MAG: hypothetical protein JWM80_4114 [Cyanobacteria bacterium RYN_339]|nr:hypothetical protein [Cyanobacteria bacterium RYN_339]
MILAMTRRLLALAFLTFALPAFAGTTVPVDLKVDPAKQIRLEKRFKELIDKWSEPGLDISFKAKPTYSLDAPGMVRVRIDGLKAAANEAWYKEYRTLYDELVKEPFALETFRHAQTYCRGGTVFMEAECQDAGGKVLYRALVHNMYSMSRAQDTQNFYFVHHLGVKLPEKPPSVAYLDHSSVSDPLWVDVPAKLAPQVAKIHLKDRPAVKWPVALESK